MTTQGGSRFRVLRADHAGERARWLDAWRSWPSSELFAHPSYVSLFARELDVPAAAVGRMHGLTVLYPFIIRPLQQERYWTEALGRCVDITSPYGYGGPYWWGEGGELPAAASAFWERFTTWARRSQVVSEFVRFDLDPTRLIPYPGTTDIRLDNVIRRLDISEDELWADVAHKVRKNVKHARRSGLQVVRDERGERLDDFIRIYERTMTDRNADERYRFTRSWFERLVRELEGGVVFFHVLKGDEVVSTELVLVSAETAYSFLGGTDRGAYQDRPNDLLKYEAILWAREVGKRAFVLGGGRRRDDGIYRYKRSFAPNGVVPFSVGSRILDHERYEALCDAAAAERRRGPGDPDLFPRYRG